MGWGKFGVAQKEVWAIIGWEAWEFGEEFWPLLIEKGTFRPL